MKTTFYFLASILFLFSCSSFNKTKESNLLVGDWDLVKIVSFTESDTIVTFNGYGDFSLHYQYKNDNTVHETVTVQGQELQRNGKYELDKDTLKLKFNEGDPLSMQIIYLFISNDSTVGKIDKEVGYDTYTFVKDGKK